jgi:hypothetical protein
MLCNLPCKPMGLKATHMDVRLQEGLTIFYVIETHIV